MGIEPTGQVIACPIGFEDQERHQTTIHSQNAKIITGSGRTAYTES